MQHRDHTPGFLAIVEDAKSRVREIGVHDTMTAMAADTRLIDVREDNEWTTCHARGAEHLGKGIIERDIETVAPDKDSPLILYCGGGYRAAIAADSLQKMGYTNVKSMAGGWRAWLKADAPTEEG
ncbi:MAG: rhodanese-like domain-containing protein [Gemmatimonadaceae bacterium]